MRKTNTTAAVSGLELVLGGRTVVAKFRDGSQEEVKVRSLPIKMMQRWGYLQGDEAALVELYCDKLDMPALFRIKNHAAHEQQLLTLLGEEKDAHKIALLRGQLTEVQEKILELESTERWDDKLTPESHDEIFEVGERINRPRFERWVENTRESTARFREEFQKAIEAAAATTNGATSGSNGSSPSSSSAPGGAGTS